MQLLHNIYISLSLNISGGATTGRHAGMQLLRMQQQHSIYMLAYTCYIPLRQLFYAIDIAYICCIPLPRHPYKHAKKKKPQKTQVGRVEAAPWSRL